MTISLRRNRCRIVRGPDSQSLPSRESFGNLGISEHRDGEVG